MQLIPHRGDAESIAPFDFGVPFVATTCQVAITINMFYLV
jgi:hypothetical protein